MTSTPASVVSGVPYPVTAVAGGSSSSLDDLVGETDFTVDLGGTAYVVRGAGNRLEDRIRFHEKAHGRDVRVWHVSSTDGGLTAEHVAAF